MGLGAGGAEGEGEDGAVAWLAGDADGTAVGVDDGAGDGEAHAGAADALAAVGVAVGLAAVELVEDHALLEGVDAGAAVGDGDGEHIALGVGGDEDGLVGGEYLAALPSRLARTLRIQSGSASAGGRLLETETRKSRPG